MRSFWACQMTLKSHSKSSTMSSFDKWHVTCYWRSIANVSWILGNYWSTITNLPHPTFIGAMLGLSPISILPKYLTIKNWTYRKPECISIDNGFGRFDIMHVWITDQNSRQHMPCYAYALYIRRALKMLQRLGIQSPRLPTGPLLWAPLGTSDNQSPNNFPQPLETSTNQSSTGKKLEMRLWFRFLRLHKFSPWYVEGKPHYGQEWVAGASKSKVGKSIDRNGRLHACMSLAFVYRLLTNNAIKFMDNNAFAKIPLVQL